MSPLLIKTRPTTAIPSCFRSKQISRGANLPAEVRFPCLLNIAQDQIFMIGSPWPDNTLMVTTKPEVYLFNKTNGNWTYFGHNFPCKYKLTHETRFTCAYLRHEKEAIVNVDNCIATFNLISYDWTSSVMMNHSGFLFNVNDEQNSVAYIGSNKVNGSDIYMVTILR